MTEEVLHHRVVVAVTLSAHTLLDSFFCNRSAAVDMGNYIDNQIDSDAASNGGLLRESIGMDSGVRE